VINASKLAILLASLVAGILGFAWLASTGARTPAPPV
jgi:Na+/H+ antiporter NhaA